MRARGETVDAVDLDLHPNEASDLAVGRRADCAGFAQAFVTVYVSSRRRSRPGHRGDDAHGPARRCGRARAAPTRAAARTPRRAIWGELTSWAAAKTPRRAGVDRAGRMADLARRMAGGLHAIDDAPTARPARRATASARRASSCASGRSRDASRRARPIDAAREGPVVGLRCTKTGRSSTALFLADARGSACGARHGRGEPDVDSDEEYFAAPDSVHRARRSVGCCRTRRTHEVPVRHPRACTGPPTGRACDRAARWTAAGATGPRSRAPPGALRARETRSRNDAAEARRGGHQTSFD